MKRLSEVDRLCDCGSGLNSVEEVDGYGIYMFRACAECYARKLKPFRPDIFTQYSTDEPIEEDE